MLEEEPILILQGLTYRLDLNQQLNSNLSMMNKNAITKHEFQKREREGGRRG